MSKKIIVIGISAAGVSALAKIRQFDKESTVTAISFEHDLPYNKCLLADFVSKDKTEADVYTRNKDFFISNNIDLLLGKKVVRVIPEQQSIVLHDGAVLIYDTLLIATGLQPFVPPIDGVDAQGVFVFNTVDDAKRLMSFIQDRKVKKAVVIGAGLTGVEITDSLTTRSIQVHLIDTADRILNRHVDVYGSTLIQGAMQAAGVQLHLNQSVVSLQADENGYAHAVTLHNGSVIETDLVILATGARIDKQFFHDAGIELTHHGVTVNEYMQTNYPSIYAAGDICRIKDQITGDFVQNSTWPDAVMQGMIAGLHIAGQSKKYPEPLIINNSHFFGGSFYSCGNFTTMTEKTVIKVENERSLYTIYLNAEGYIIGFYVFGEVLHLSKLKSLIVAKTLVSQEDLTLFLAK